MGIDIWHATGQFVQLGILILFSYSFFEKSKPVQLLNKPLGSLICWAGLVTGYYWISVFSETKHYPVKIFMPFFNLLCLVWLYKIIVEYATSGCIEKILKWAKYSILLILFYCTLQYLSLDQFFRSIDIGIRKDMLVGTIGNQSHLAGFLAIVQPLFFKKNRQDILSLILLWLIITLTTSASGFLCGLAVIGFWLFFNYKKTAISFSIISVGLIVAIFIKYSVYFSSSGRFEMWVKVLDIFRDKPITGFALGSFGALKIKTSGHWQHLHNEFYQIAFELGIIGLVLVLWCIWDYFKTFRTIKSDTTIKLASIFFGFCLLGLMTFGAHLWLISVYGMFAYASLYALKNRENFQ